MTTRPSALLDDLDTAHLALAPIRRRILAALTEPASAAGLAEQLDMPRQKIGYHLRALEDALLEFAGCVLVISHDRWFLDRIATHILAFEGESQATFFSGNYQEYEADKRKRLGEEGVKPKRLRFKPLKS